VKTILVVLGSVVALAAIGLGLLLWPPAALEFVVFL